MEAKSVLERLAKDNKKTLPIGRLVLQQETKVSISLDADEEDYSEDFDVQELIASDPRPSKVSYVIHPIDVKSVVIL